MEITITIKLTDDELKDLFKEDTENVEKDHHVEANEYARFFDSSCACWNKDPEFNLYFLRQQESYMNEKLRHTGYLFLNEVYDALSIPRTKAGQTMGWLFDADDPTRCDYVSFGIFEDCNASAVNGYGERILLNFNVDRNILDYM